MSHPEYVKAKCRLLRERGMRVAAIPDAIEREYGAVARVSVSSVKDWTRGVEPTNAAPWSLADSDPQVADQLGFLVAWRLRRAGSLLAGWPTAEEAHQAERIWKMVPTLSVVETWRLVGLFIAAKDAGDADAIRELEYLLLVAPWPVDGSGRGMHGQGRADYLALVRLGVIKGVWFSPGASDPPPTDGVEVDRMVAAQAEVDALLDSPIQARIRELGAVMGPPIAATSVPNE